MIFPLVRVSDGPFGADVLAGVPWYRSDADPMFELTPEAACCREYVGRFVGVMARDWPSPLTLEDGRR